MRAAVGLGNCPRWLILRAGVSYAVACVVMLGIMLSPLWAAQKSSKPITKDEVISLLKGEVPSPRIAELVRERGTSFAVTRQTETQLREAGATEELLKALRQAAPRAATPSRPPTRPPAVPTSTTQTEHPVLIVEAKPGGAQVYIDDALMGTTSAQGRLRLPQLNPGEHRVRLALLGRQDYEDKIELRSGETTRLLANLEPAKTTPPRGSEGEKTVQGTSGGETSSLEQQIARMLGSQQPGGSTPAATEGPGTAQTLSPGGGFQSFAVAHDHGPPYPNGCVGLMMVGNGMIGYRSADGIHYFQDSLTNVKEAKKNALYLAGVGGFHIALRNGYTYNFVAMNPYNQPMPPDAVLAAIQQAMGRR
jgi:hypothetical protein